MNEYTEGEFNRFGKAYYDEALRILAHIPRLPQKYI